MSTATTAAPPFSAAGSMPLALIRSHESATTANNGPQTMEQEEKHAGGLVDSASVPAEETSDSARNVAADDYGARPDCFRTTAQEFLFVFIATMAMGSGSILAGVSSVIPYFVQIDLHMSQAEVTWLTASSGLASGSFLLFFGRLADLFGRKSLLIAAFLLFAVFNMACGFARTPIVLDLLNGFLGLTCAAAVPPAQGSLSIVYGKPSRRKNAAFACFSAGNPIGFAMGMIFGGIATQIFDWRASYFLLAIIYLVLAILAIFCMPKDTTPKRKLDWETFQRFDVVGMLLTVGGVGMFSASLSLGPTGSEGFKTPYILALLLVGFALIVAFVIWESFYKYPLLPMHIWKDKNFSLVVLICGAGMAAFTPAALFVALFFQRVWGFSSISTAVHLLPMVIMGLSVNIFAGSFLHRINNKMLMLVGALAYTLCFILLALNRTSSSYWAFFFPGLTLVVVGADLEFNVANMYVMTSLAPDQQSIASGIFQTCIKLFQTVSYGLITAVYDSVAENPDMGGYYKGYPASQPYSAAFWYAAGIAASSCVLVAFLSIKTQGGSEKVVVVAEEGA